MGNDDPLFCCRRCFSDWDDICKTLDMNAHLPKPVAEKKEDKEEEKKTTEKEEAATDEKVGNLVA